MLLAKMGFGAFLTAMFLAITGPAFLMQDSGPGKPDDVAELLPKETMLFAEIVRAPKVLHDWKDFVGAVCTEAGKKNVCDEIEKAVKPAIEMIPEKLLKDLEAGLPSIQRIAVAMLDPELDESSFAFICTSSDETFFKKVVEDLKVFAGEEIAHQGQTVLVIRKLGEMRFGNGLLVCAMGKRLVISMSAPTMYRILDRAAGKAKGEDLRAHRLYKQLSTAATEDPVIRAFADMPWDLMDGRNYGGGYRARRSSAFSMDHMDAILDFRKLRGTTLEATLKPGRITSKTRIHIDAPCRLYDVFKQPAGAKETLKFVPPLAMVAAHVNLKGGAEVWPQIVAMFKRADAIETKTRRREQERDTLKQANDEMEREIGVKLDDIANLVGKEVAFAMVGEDPFGGERNALESLLFVVQVTDAEKAKELIDKITSKMGPYETKSEKDVTQWLFKEEGQPMPIFALTGKTVLIATKADVLTASLKAGTDGGAFLKALPEGAASASKVISVKHEALWKFTMMAARGQVPDLSKDLKLDGWSTILVTEEKDFVELSATDVGVALVSHAGLVAFPIMILSFSPRMMPNDGAIPAPRAEIKDPPALAPEKLAAELKKHLGDLKSDEVATRDAAMQSLRAIGRQAAALLAETWKKETDGEVKGRVLELLMEWKAYEVLPDLAQKKADAFLQEFLKSMGGENDPSGRQQFLNWDQNDGVEFYGWYLEPYYVNLSMIQRMVHRDALETPAAMKCLGEVLLNDKTPEETRKLVAQILAFTDSAAATESVLAAMAKSEDAPMKVYLQMALGWSTNPKASERVLAGLRDGSKAVCRASFIAAERSRDPAVVTKLIELLKDSDAEVQWNASYTLRRLTNDRVWVNVFAPDDEVKAQIAAGSQWWEKNKAAWTK